QVDRGAGDIVCEVLDEEQEVGQLAEGAGAFGRVVAGVRAPACEGSRVAAHALAPDLQRPVFTRRLEDQDAVMTPSKLFDQLARVSAARLFVRRDEQRDVAGERRAAR